jgi:phenylacetate-CoA ligase
MFPVLPEAVVRNIVYPVYRGFRKDSVLDILDELEHNQFLPAGELEDLAWRKLKALLEYAGRHVPYYSELFEREGIDPASFDGPSDISRIPLLTREAILGAKSGMISKDPLRRGYPSRGKGDKGPAGDLWCDVSSAPLRRAAAMRGYRWTGFDIGCRQALLWGFPAGRPPGEKIRAGARNFFNNILPMSSFDMSPQAMKRYAAKLKRFRPRVVTGYPSALAALARFCLDNRVSLPPPKAVVTGGESLLAHQRELIGQAFGAEVYDRYGSREFSIIAHECPGHRGLHLFSDLFHVELLGEDGRPVRRGERGELAVTDLSNFYMPFIRYRTGDFAAAAPAACSCGRTLPLIESLERSADEEVVAAEGKVVDYIKTSPEGRERVVVTDMEERLIVKSKIHKAHISGESPDENDCLRIDSRLMELGDIAPWENVLIVNATNGARLETFAREAVKESGDIIACGAVSRLCRPGDEISVMAFTWSSAEKSEFSNILVDEDNRFVRYLTEKAGDMI